MPPFVVFVHEPLPALRALMRGSAAILALIVFLATLTGARYAPTVLSLIFVRPAFE